MNVLAGVQSASKGGLYRSGDDGPVVPADTLDHSGPYPHSHENRGVGHEGDYNSHCNHSWAPIFIVQRRRISRGWPTHCELQ